MKQNTHPEMHTVTVTCTGCGNEFETLSTNKQLSVGICSNCHPFFTGQKKFLDAAGRIDKFNARRKKSQEKQATKK